MNLNMLMGKIAQRARMTAIIKRLVTMGLESDIETGASARYVFPCLNPVNASVAKNGKFYMENWRTLTASLHMPILKRQFFILRYC